MISSNWKPKGFGGFDFKSIFKNPFKKDVSTNASSYVNPNMPTQKKNLSGFIKGLGVTGAVLALVIGIFALLAFLFVIKPGYVVLASVNKLKADVTLLGEDFRKQDIDAIQATLAVLKSDLTDVRLARNQNFGWAQNFGPTKDYYSDVDHFVEAGLYACDAISEFVTVVSPFADAAGFKTNANVEVQDPNASSGLADAFANWVKIMPEVASKMDGVIEKADKVGEEMEKIDANRYPENVGGFPVKSNIEAAQQYLSQAKEFGPDIKAALTVIPTVLGVGQEKRYAIIFQNNGEIRPTGGFWTNYATFRILNAALTSDFTSKDMYSIDDIIATTDTAYTSPFLPPTPFYRDFLKVEHTYARDSNYYPDYVSSVDAWMKYYRQAGFINPYEVKPINGAFAIDTEVVKRLLEVTGPVTVQGVTFDSSNVVLELEKQASLTLREQQGRKKVLGDLMEEMLLNIYKSDKNLWPKVTETAIKLAMEKHMLAYVFDNPEAQRLLERYNFAGRLMPHEGGDYTYIVSTNLAGDKNNLFVTKDVTHNITQEGGKVMHEVIINYHFNEPQPGYEVLVSTYRDWVRVYAPAGSKLISLEGSDATTESDYGEESGKVYFAGHITLPPQETRTIKFKYEVPASVLGVDSYSVYLQKQPGTFNDMHTVNVKGKTATAELLTDKIVTVRF